MTEAEWRTCAKPEILLAALGEAQVLTPRKARLFACACARRVEQWMADERSRRAVEVAEQFADGLAGRRGLSAARRDAFAACKSAGRVPVAGLNVDEHAAAVALHAAADDRKLRPAMLAYSVAGCASSLMAHVVGGEAEPLERESQADVVRDIFGSPQSPAQFDPTWRTETAVLLAKGMYEGRDFSAMPILADALQDSGCESEDVLSHCRGPGPHCRGCWVVDLILGKE